MASNALLTEQIAFLDILLFILGVSIVVGIGSILGSGLRPHKPNPEKLTNYESGEHPIGSPWAPFNARFYSIGLLFILFEVETILLFPWAVTWLDPTLNNMTHKMWSYYTATIATSLLLVLIVALYYAYAHGYLITKKSPPEIPSLPQAIPPIHYQKINRLYSQNDTQSTSKS